MSVSVDVKLCFLCNTKIVKKDMYNYFHDQMAKFYFALLYLAVSGKILPPENFKKYHHRFIPMDLSQSEASDDPVRVDMFGQKTKPAVKSGPYLWKLTSKLNRPEYVKVSQEVERRKAEHKQKMVTFKPLQRSLPVETAVN